MFYEFPQWIGAAAGRFGIVDAMGRPQIEAPYLGDRGTMLRKLSWAQWSAEELRSRGSRLLSTVLVLTSTKQRARRYVCPWLAAGAERAGDKVKRMGAPEYREPCSDVLVHYGFDGSQESNIAKAHDEYVAAGLRAVYVDLGYFKMKEKLGRFRFYHRFSINDRHPTAYFQNVSASARPGRRARDQGRKENAAGSRIILCGMSEKASAFDGAIGWEEATIAELRKHTERPIIHRPKPGRERCPALPKIPTADGYSDPERRTLKDELADAWAVVSHHSNAGLDALVAGVPCFQEEGVALVLGWRITSSIETPRLPTLEERQQLVNDVCYTQFNGGEAAAGIAWRHFRDEGLL